MAGTPKDHYVPQFYLDAFAIEGPGSKEPHIYQYMDEGIISARIRDVAGEKHFYTVESKQVGGPVRDVDDLFTQVEGLAAGPLKKIIQQENLNISDEERENLSIFFGMLAVRTPGFLKGQESMEVEAIKEMHALQALDEEHFRKSYAKAGIHLEGRALDEQREFVLKKDYEVKINGKGHFLAQGLRISMELAEWYYQRKHWHLLINETDRVFVSSDHPISIFKPSFERPFMNAGFGNGTLLIPLSPKLALWLRDVRCRSEIINVGPDRVSELNKNTMRFSDNYVYSNLKSKSIAETYRTTGKKHFQKTEIKRHKFAPYIFMGPPPVPQEPVF